MQDSVQMCIAGTVWVVVRVGEFVAASSCCLDVDFVVASVDSVFGDWSECWD